MAGGGYLAPVSAGGRVRRGGEVKYARQGIHHQKGAAAPPDVRPPLPPCPFPFPRPQPAFSARHRRDYLRLGEGENPNGRMEKGRTQRNKSKTKRNC